jgi:branched-chain amino acid aminotransferase
MILQEQMINIQRVAESRISQTDFDNLKFGREFSDHMFVMDYADGQWQAPVIKGFEHLSLNPASSVLHYGQAIFEGMKAFKNDDGEVFLFRPERNIKRFNLSAERMCMPTVDEEIFQAGLAELVKLDHQWIPSKKDSALYVRPFMFATDEYIGVKPSETYRFMIFTCPVDKYYAGAVKVKVETKFARAFPGGTGFAKAAGNYAGALYPAKLAQEQGYHQLIWTDALEHKYIEESGTMNIVFRSGNRVFSPKSSETILAGITRDSIMQLAKDYGYEVEERRVEVEEIYNMMANNELDEAFGAGTAATVAPMSAIAFEDRTFDLPPYEAWEFAPRAAKDLDAIKRGQRPDLHAWNFQVV